MFNVQTALCPSLQPGLLISLGRLVTSFGSHCWQDISRAKSASTLNSHQPDQSQINSHQPDQPPLGYQPDLTLLPKDHSAKASDSVNKKCQKLPKRTTKRWFLQVASYLFVCRGDWCLVVTDEDWQKLAIDDWWSRSHRMHKCIESHRCKIVTSFCNIDATQMHYQLFTPVFRSQFAI